MLNEGSNWTRKKNRVYKNYKLQEKTASHDMQICVSWKQFLSADWLFTVNFAVNFQSKAEQPLCFLITFLSRSCLFSYVSIPTCCVSLSELFSGETICNNGDLQKIIDLVSRSWVFCMLSKRISRFSLSIVSEMTENPTAKFVKFWFRATLLINLGRSSVVGRVARILAAL